MFSAILKRYWGFFWALAIMIASVSFSDSAMAAPAAPSLLSGTAISQNQVNLSWRDNSSYELGFTVERSISMSSGYSQIARLRANTISFTDSNLLSATTYYYRIRAYTLKGNRYVYSSYSNIANVRTLSPAPTPAPTPTVQVSATQVSPGQTVTVTVNGTGLDVSEWTALYVASQPDSAWSYQENWMYLNGLKTLPSTPLKSATLQFKAPLESGTYNIRLFPKTGFENRIAVSANFVVNAVATPLPSPEYVTYTRVLNGVKRTFDFDGATPFVNPTTGQSDFLGWLYNAIEVYSYEITNAGRAPWIQKFNDNGSQVTRFQVFPSDAQLYSWRTQADGPQFERFKHYRYEIEFKLDPSWDFNMLGGDGLLWQAKGYPKSGQFGHAAMGVNIQRDNLYFALLYPNNALRCTTWPCSVTWPGNDYAATNFPTRKITSGRYYRLRIDLFADDRPEKFGGQGYVNIYLDDQLWIQHKGPNLHPDQAGDHRFDYGWYNWGGQPSSTRTIYFKKSHLYVK